MALQFSYAFDVGIKMKYCELISVTNLIYHLPRLCMSSSEPSCRISLAACVFMMHFCLIFIFLTRNENVSHFYCFVNRHLFVQNEKNGKFAFGGE
jgi:hypothetical protein